MLAPWAFEKGRILSDLGAEVRKELIAKKKIISIRKVELDEWAEKRENKWRGRR